jgi:predicted nucleotidyltransferase
MGSVSHGTTEPQHDPDSIDDVDLMGVIFPPATHIIGLHQFEHWTCQVEELDVTIYGFQKFVRLLLKGNPNVVGLLWLPERFYVHRSRAFERLLFHRDAFSSKQMYRPFVGYGRSQLSQMKKSEYRGYMGPKRRALVDQFGYDTKFAAHLIRLLRMAEEFLETGTLRVDRTGHDADELKAIKRGEWSYEQVVNAAQELFARLERSYERSTLPDEPDYDTVEALICEETLAMLNRAMSSVR